LVTPIETGSAHNPTNANANLPTVTLGDGDVITGYTGPGTYKDSGGHPISVGSDNLVTPIETGYNPSNVNLPSTSKLPTADLGNGNTISDYKGPGTYTISPGNVVSVGSAGDYSFISGHGVSGADAGTASLPSVNLPTITLGDGDVITGFTGPGTYTDSGGHVLSVGSDKGITPVQSGSIQKLTTSNANLPTVTLGDGDVISDYTGPGIYTDSGGHAISVGSDNLVTPIETAPKDTQAASTIKLPETSKLPNINLGYGNTLSGYKGPGIYTISPGNVISLGDGGAFSFVSGTGANGMSGGSVSVPVLNLPGITLGNGKVITGYTGPGTYTDSSGNVVSIGSNGAIATVTSDSKTIGQGFPGITLPSVNLPTLSLGGGINLDHYKGPGVYTISPGNVVSVDASGSFSFISGSGADGNKQGSLALPSFSLPTVSLAGGISLDAFTGPGVYTYSPGNVVSIDANGGVNWLQGGPKTVSGGGFTFPTSVLPSITLPNLNLPSVNLNFGNDIPNYHGPGIYTISPGNVVSIDKGGSYSYLMGSGSFGVKSGSISLPTYSLPGITLQNGISVPKYSGPGIYTVSPGNVLSIGSDGGYKWLQGGPQTLSGGGITLPSYDLSANIPSPSGTYFNGVNFKFPFNIPSFNGPGFYSLSPGNVVEVHADGSYSFVSGGPPNPNGGNLSFPSVSLPKINFPTLNLGSGITLGDYKGPGLYTISPGNVVSISPGGSFSYISGSGANGSQGGSIALPNLSLPTLSLAGGISLDAFTGPGVYTYSPGNVVSVDGNGGVNWLRGGPQSASGGGFTFPTPALPSISLPSLNLPNANLGAGYSIPNFHGPGIYTISPGNVVSVAANGAYTYLMGSGFLGATTGSMSLPTYSLPGITLQNGISVPKYSGPGIYTISPGNVLSIGAGGRYKWLQGGPQTLSGGGITLPSYDLSGAVPTSNGWYINGVNYKFPFDIPSFNGPGFYSLSPGNVVQVHVDGSYTFVLGGPPNPNAGKLSFPSITLPKINFSTLNLGSGITLGDYKGPGLYTISPGNVVSISPGGSFSYISGSGANGSQGGSIALPNLSLPTLSLAGGISLDAFAGPGVYTYSPGNVVSIGANGAVNWLQGGPKTASGGGFTFPTPALPSITLPSVSLPNAGFGVGSSIHNYHGPGIYTISPGNVVSVAADGSYTYLLGSGFLGLRTGSMSLPTYSLPGITLQNGISVPKYSGPGIYTVSPGNVLSIGAGGRYKWLQGGPQTLPGGGITLQSVDMSGALPTFSGRFINGVDFEFPFDIPGFNGPGFYSLSPGNVVQVHADGSYVFISGGPPNPSGGKITYPSVTLPNIDFPTLNLGSGITLGDYKGPGLYTISPGNVVSISPGGSFSYISGSGANGSQGGSIALPNLSLPTLSLAGGISLDAFAGPGVYTYSPGNVVSIGANGAVNWLAGGPQPVSNGGFTFPTPALPSITLPSVSLPNAGFGVGSSIHNYHGPGIYTISPGNVVSVAADGSYTYLLGSGFLGLRTGSMSLPTYSLPGITLQNGISVPKYSGPGIYTVSPGNVLSIGAGGRYKWLQGGPQSLPGGDFTLPSYDMSGVPPMPLETYIGGVHFIFPFDVPSFNGPGFYTLSPGNIIQVHIDGSYIFISGGPPNPSGGKITYPSVSLPNVHYSTLNLGGGVSIDKYKGPGEYTLGSGNVVSVAPGGSFSFVSGSGTNGVISGSITLPDLSLPTLSLAGGISLDAFAGPGVYTYSPGNVVSIGANGAVNWLAGGPQPVSNGGFTFPTPALPSITLPTVTLPNANFGIGYNIRNFHGPGIYTISAGNVLSVAADGSYTYLMGNGFLGAKTGSMSLPTYTLPSITLQGGISVPKYSGPGIYTVSPGNIISIGSGGGYKWLQGGPQSLPGGDYTLPSYDLSGAPPLPVDTYINGVHFEFPFDVPSFTGPGFYILSPGNIIQVHIDGSYIFISGGPPDSKISYPSVTLPNFSLSTLNLGGGVSIDKYKGPGEYTLGSGNVVSVAPGGSFSFVSGSGTNGVISGSITLPDLSLPTLSLAGGISLDAFAGPGVYTYSPGNVVSIGANGAVNWLAGGPQYAPGGGFIFPTPDLPSIALPTVTLPNANFGVGYNIRNYHGPGIYTISSGHVLSVAADGSYTYLMGNGFFGAKTGSMSLPTYSLPSITLQGGISVPKYSGPGIYTVSPGNVLEIEADGRYEWLQGGPQTLDGGGITLPSYSVAAEPNPTSTIINGVNFKFPFNIPEFKGPGFYSLSPGNVVQVHHDGSYVFVMGGPPEGSSSPTTSTSPGLPSLGGSITLPNLSLPYLNLPNNVRITGYTGPGVYSLGFNTVVSISPNGQYSYVHGSLFFGANSGIVNLPTASFPTLSFAGNTQIPNYKGPGVYTVSPGNVLSLDSDGSINWLQGGPDSVVAKATSTAQAIAATTTVALPSVTYPGINVPFAGSISAYTGAGVYTINAQQVITISSNGAYSFILGSGAFGLKNGNLILPNIHYPTVSLPDGFKVPSYSAPGTYTASPGNVVSIGSNGDFSWISGGPVAPKAGLATTINNINYNFPFTIPNFTGAGVYTLSSGNVVKVNGDGSYSFTSGGPPALRAAAANNIDYSESNQQASTTASKGFVLPGFSFPSFSRRSVSEDSGSAENIKDSKNQNNFFKNVLSLF
ncbi:hypothetical protein INT48_007771, partial [Thamnidium elegans]